MATCNIYDKSNIEMKKNHNDILKASNDLKEDIKNSHPFATNEYVEDVAETILEENNIPSMLGEDSKPQALYRLFNGTKKTDSIGVHNIEKINDGYSVLYTTDKTNEARIVYIAKDGFVITKDGKPNQRNTQTSYDMTNLKNIEKKLNRRNQILQDRQKAADEELKKAEVPAKEFYSEDGRKIKFTKRNAEIIQAELINDTSKSEQVLDELLEIDNTFVSAEQSKMLHDALKHNTSMLKKVIPDMIQVINKNTDKVTGKLTMEGKDAGLWVNTGNGVVVAGNQMSAGEAYVHEMIHASIEFALLNHKDYLSNTINDIQYVYKKFLENITEEDFMPSLDDSIDRDVERQNAKNRIKYLKNPKTGFNEFIVMSQTNTVVRDVLDRSVTAGYDKKRGKTIYQKLIAFIQNIYNSLYTLKRLEPENRNGLYAMNKYVQELNAVNNIAIGKISNHNFIINGMNKIMKVANSKSSTQLKKLIKKMQSKVDPKNEKELKELEKKLVNYKNMNILDKTKFLMEIFSSWMISNNPRVIGSFESWLELIGGRFTKPEGTIQQLIRVFRDSDEYETKVERLGLASNKIESEVEEIMTAQSELINKLIGKDLSDIQSSMLTKTILDIDLKSLVDEQYNGSEKEQIASIQEMLINDEKLKKEIEDVKNEIILTSKNKNESNFIINQSIALGNYMVNGNGGLGSLLNSYMIYGLANLDISRNNIISRNELDVNGRKKMLIDRLATLEGITHTSENSRNYTAEIIKSDPKAFKSILNYDEMLGIQLNENGKSSSFDGNGYNMHKVKGYHDKVSANYITPKVEYTKNKLKMEKENYIKIDGGSYSSQFSLYINSDYTEPGIKPEGLRITNDGNSINSFINVLKNSFITDNSSPFDIIQIKKTKAHVNAELMIKEKTVISELRKMQKENYIQSDLSMSPIFKTDRNGKMFVTDFDISVNKQLLEDQTRTSNKINAVLGKSYSRSIDINESKKVNADILDLIQRDAEENYDETRDYYSGGKENFMSYVKIGPNEDNEISKEIWPFIPRYIKLEIMKRHSANMFRQQKILAEEVTSNDLTSMQKIFTTDINKMNKDLKKMRKNQKSTNQEIKKKSTDAKINKLSQKMNIEIKNNLKRYIDNMPDKEKAKEIRTKMAEINQTEPYLAVRRNEVYHLFGNRETQLLNYGNKKWLNMTIKLLKQADELYRHFVKISKVNMVLRNVSTLAANIVSNFILAILQGQDPISEFNNQLKGAMQLNKYIEDQKKATVLKLKIKSDNHTQADIDELNYLTNKINNNPVKPLINAGLYTAISEDLSNQELHTESYFDSKTSELVEKIPDKVKDTFNFLYITKNTEAFKALLMLMQQSDFAARYSTYYKLIGQGWSHEKAIKKVLDNQINYGFKSGKTMQWLNDRGALLFTKFIEGIQRVIRNTAIDQPITTLLALLSGGFLFEDSPLGDNAFSINYGNRIQSPFDMAEVLSEPAMLKPFM